MGGNHINMLMLFQSNTCQSLLYVESEEPIVINHVLILAAKVIIPFFSVGDDFSKCASEIKQVASDILARRSASTNADY
jgi:hypothetical protein